MDRPCLSRRRVSQGPSPTSGISAGRPIRVATGADDRSLALSSCSGPGSHRHRPGVLVAGTHVHLACRRWLYHVLAVGVFAAFVADRRAVRITTVGMPQRVLCLDVRNSGHQTLARRCHTPTAILADTLRRSWTVAAGQAVAATIGTSGDTSTWTVNPVASSCELRDQHLRRCDQGESSTAADNRKCLKCGQN